MGPDRWTHGVHRRARGSLTGRLLRSPYFRLSHLRALGLTLLEGQGGNSIGDITIRIGTQILRRRRWKLLAGGNGRLWLGTATLRLWGRISLSRRAIARFHCGVWASVWTGAHLRQRGVWWLHENGRFSWGYGLLRTNRDWLVGAALEIQVLVFPPHLTAQLFHSLDMLLAPLVGLILVLALKNLLAHYTLNFLHVGFFFALGRAVDGLVVAASLDPIRHDGVKVLLLIRRPWSRRLRGYGAAQGLLPIRVCLRIWEVARIPLPREAH